MGIAHLTQQGTGQTMGTIGGRFKGGEYTPQRPGKDSRDESKSVVESGISGRVSELGKKS
jgi:hypothetical protein